MDRGPVIFTSDVSLPKDDKKASEVNKSQLGNWQDYDGTAMLTMLQRKEGLKSNGQTEIQLHLLRIIHLEISIQNISLVLSCESHPKCKFKATDDCINKLCVR